MTAHQIRRAIVGHAIAESPYGPDQGGTTFFEDGTSRRDGFVSNRAGTYEITDGKVIITQELRKGIPSFITIELFADSDQRMFYRYASPGSNDEPRPLKLLPISPN